MNREDLLIDTAQMEGYVSEDDNGITVVLDTNLTPRNFWKKDSYVRSSAKYRRCVRKPISRSWIRSVITYEGSEKAETVFAEKCR